MGDIGPQRRHYEVLLERSSSTESSIVHAHVPDPDPMPVPAPEPLPDPDTGPAPEPVPQPPSLSTHR